MFAAGRTAPVRRSAGARLEIVAKQPTGVARATPLLLVHGAWHGAWCWERFQAYFAEQGWATYAVSLRGHGKSHGRERIRWVRAAEYLADLVDAVETLPREPVLIGHSAGGYLVQRWLETRSAAGAVLLASVSSQGASKLFGRMYRRHPLQAVKAHLLLDAFRLIGTPDIAREAFFSADVPAAELQEHYARLQQESYAFGWDMVLRAPRPDLARKAPMLVLGAENDVVIARGEVRRTAEAYGVEAEIFPGMAHDMMLERDWRKVAERIARWLRDAGL